MAIYVSGSLAFDRIMTFPGNFQDHILMDKLHMINVSFMVDGMDERRGGCAGNIAYTLALLDEKPVIVAAAGRDFESYAQTLASHGLPLDGIRRAEDVFTALCYITTDLNSNQITGFYPGAMTLPAVYDFPGMDARQDIAIVSPGNVEDMRRLPRMYREKGVPYIFDPGQQLPVLTSEELLEAIEGSLACITNDYELNMICKATGKSEDEIAARTSWLVTTLGAEGAQVRGQGETVRIAPVPIDKVLDPTGAGDAHRAGLIKGLVNGLAMPEAAKLGSVSASFALEKMGTQEHVITPANFRQRYEAVFGALPKGIFAE
ncbi:MAG: carbohydrate kinase family protein [Desulfovibrio sp.]|uniref:carbohydrate kinase family protein n=1 Tax=Desulfovibrio sp. TaxID=885 RepID=UPI0039E2B2C8